MWEFNFADNQKHVYCRTFFMILKNFRGTFFQGTHFLDCSKINSQIICKIISHTGAANPVLFWEIDIPKLSQKTER